MCTAVYEHKASKGKRIMLTDLVKSGGSGELPLVRWLTPVAVHLTPVAYGDLSEHGDICTE